MTGFWSTSAHSSRANRRIRDGGAGPAGFPPRLDGRRGPVRPRDSAGGEPAGKA
jgi:hypothetical protein